MIQRSCLGKDVYLPEDGSPRSVDLAECAEDVIVRLTGRQSVQQNLSVVLSGIYLIKAKHETPTDTFISNDAQETNDK